MNIEFDELPFLLGGISAFPLAGNFDVEPDGSISTIWIEEWGVSRGRKPKLIRLDENSEGMSRVFWMWLPPILRRKYAEEIADQFHAVRPWRPSEHAIGPFEAGVGR